MKKNLKFIILGVLMVALVVGYYYYISNKRTVNDVEEVTSKITIVQKLINRNIAKDYPQTPREVAKLYADITVAFYTEEYSDEELELLGLKLRELFDEELLGANPESAYLSALKNEIMAYKNQGISFSSYATSAAVDVEFFDKNGFEWARMYVTFTVRQGANAGLAKEVFILRKDGNKHWKIYGWDAVDERE